MKKLLALLVVCTVLIGYVAPVFASGRHLREIQATRAHKKWLKHQVEFWKKFDAEMAHLEGEAESNVPVTRGERWRQPK